MFIIYNKSTSVIAWKYYINDSSKNRKIIFYASFWGIRTYLKSQLKLKPNSSSSNSTSLNRTLSPPRISFPAQF